MQSLAAPTRVSLGEMIQALWPLSRSYEYAAELGLTLRMKRPKLWTEWADQEEQSYPLPQAAGLAFLGWVEGSHPEELQQALPHLISGAPAHMRIELRESFACLERDYTPRSEALELPAAAVGPIRAGLRLVTSPLAPHVRREWTSELTAGWALTHRESTPASEQEILRAHSHRYWEGLLSQAQTGPALLTPETPLQADDPPRLLAAAGAVRDAARWALDEPGAPVWAAVSPGSHHSSRTRGGGSCLINNLAVAARSLIRSHRLRRVAILDLDAHHGNGTEELFYEDPSVLAASVHQYPFFPGTGERGATGRGRGARLNRNYPLEAGASAESWERAVELALVKIRRFQPELILIELSTDAHAADPVADLKATDESFRHAGELVAETAAACRAAVACELGNSLSRRAWLGGLGEFAAGASAAH